jgi:hypothetical protein
VGVQLVDIGLEWEAQLERWLPVGVQLDIGQREAHVECWLPVGVQLGIGLEWEAYSGSGPQL